MTTTTRRAGLLTALVAATALLVTFGLAPEAGARAAAPAAAPWAGRTPGAPVAPLPVFNHGFYGGTNEVTGNVPSTTKIGVPDPGVVPELGDPADHADDGAYVAYETRMSARVVDLMVVSPALGGASPVRLVLPPDYATRSEWPLLFLFHGGGDQAEYQSWTLYGNITGFAPARRAIVVMPTTGQDATVTNWYLGGTYRSDQYDTFVATELPQLLRRGYRGGTRMATAGVSSGGYSAVAVAMHHPGEFGAAASMSGQLQTLDPRLTPGIQFGALLYLHSPLDIWGDPTTDHDVWAANDPAAQCGSLRGTSLFVSAGDGVTGPLSPPDWIDDPVEAKTRLSEQLFVKACARDGVAVTSHFYSPGTHSWGYWNREFRRAWPQLATALGIPAG